MDHQTLLDEETGLCNEAFFRAALPTRVAMGRRLLRPISIVLLQFGDDEGKPQRCSPDAARQIAYGLLDSLRESDTACRLGDGGFALVLEDTPENGAVWTIERLRRFLAAQNAVMTMWAGVAAYPAHALESPAILEAAHEALTRAMQWPQSRIELAFPEM